MSNEIHIVVNDSICSSPLKVTGFVLNLTTSATGSGGVGYGYGYFSTTIRDENYQTLESFVTQVFTNQTSNTIIHWPLKTSPTASTVVGRFRIFEFRFINGTTITFNELRQVCPCKEYVLPPHATNSSCAVGSTQPYGTSCLVTKCDAGYGYGYGLNNLILNPNFTYPIQLNLSSNTPGWSRYTNSLEGIIPGWIFDQGVIVRDIPSSPWRFESPFPTNDFGRQMLNIQNHGNTRFARIKQTIFLPSGQYELSFYTASRPGYSSNTFKIRITSSSIDSPSADRVLDYLYTPMSTKWTLVTLPPIIITMGQSYILTIEGQPPDNVQDWNAGLTGLNLRSLPTQCGIDGWSSNSNECMELPCRLNYTVSASTPPIPNGSFGTCPKSITSDGSTFLASGMNCSFQCLPGYQLFGEPFSCTRGIVTGGQQTCQGE